MHAKELKIIDHANISCNELNRSKIHLNKVVTKLMARNFTKYIYNNTDKDDATWEFVSNIAEFLSTNDAAFIPDVDELKETIIAHATAQNHSNVVW